MTNSGIYAGEKHERRRGWLFASLRAKSPELVIRRQTLHIHAAAEFFEHAEA